MSKYKPARFWSVSGSILLKSDVKGSTYKRPLGLQRVFLCKLLSRAEGPRRGEPRRLLETTEQRKSSGAKCGVWLATEAVVLTVRCTTGEGGGGSVIVGGI